MKFHQTKLNNGLQVIAELNASVHSVAIGYFVRTGSRDETDEVSGVSHFLEHMAFKGNDQFSADDINRMFDDIGADFNAQTSEEVTLFHAAILPEYLPQTFELLSVLLYPSLRQDDFDMEKNVIQEEIGMYADMPFWTAHERSMELHFAGHPLGRSILGTVESVGALTCEQMRQYHADHYKGGSITLAVAGNTSWDQVLELAHQYCDHWPTGGFERPSDEARPQGGTDCIAKADSLQQHVLRMAPGPNARSELRYAAKLLSVVVGDDSNSRLYWDIVDPGHAEAAEIGFHEYDGSGAYVTYLGCEPETAAENLGRIEAIFESVNRDGITNEELEQAKNKVASGIVLHSERPMGRLWPLGVNWVYRQNYKTVKDDLNTVHSVSTDDIRELLQAYPLTMTTTVGVGPLESLAT